MRSEVERHVRAEIDRHVRSEMDMHTNMVLERKESEWKEERQEELAVKANLAELHQVRKETTELASRILSFSKELHDLQASLPRRLDTLLLVRDSHEAGNGLLVKERSDIQSRVVLEELRDELEELKGKMKKKVERGELQEAMKSLTDLSSGGLPQSPGRRKGKYITKEELVDMLKQKVDFNEFMNSLSLKIDRNDLQIILARDLMNPNKSPTPDSAKNNFNQSEIKYVLN